MEIRHFTCTNCPMGCPLSVTIDDQGQVVEVQGNTCPKGDAYGQSEAVHPLRIVTSVVPVLHGDLLMVSCKTSQPIPKEKMFDVIQALKSVRFEAPIHIGDVLIENVANTSASIIATKEVQRI